MPIETDGDRDKTTPLTSVGKDFFTYDIERALLDGRIDIAVHSAKDLEGEPLPGLVIAATTRSISIFDSLVSREGLKLKELPCKAIIGTSSKKRKLGIKSFRRDLIAKDLRGNIDERLDKLDNGEYDAIIVAHAALIRLGYQDRITEIIDPSIIRPHPLQGRLAIEVRQDRKDLIELFKKIDGA